MSETYQHFMDFVHTNYFSKLNDLFLKLNFE